MSGAATGDPELLLVHVRRDVLEQRRAEVALRGIRQDAANDAALRRAFRERSRAGEGAAGRYAHENAFPAREFARPFHGLGAADGEHLVDVTRSEERRV